MDPVSLDSVVTPDLFATILCDDLQLPSSKFAPIIIRSMTEQLADFVTHAPKSIYRSSSSRGNGGFESEEEGILKEGTGDLRIPIKVSSLEDK